jgi:hypothetical protein
MITVFAVLLVISIFSNINLLRKYISLKEDYERVLKYSVSYDFKRR